MPAKINRTVIICALLILLCLSLASCDAEEKCSHESVLSEIVNPTCDSEGYTKNLCEACKYEYKSDFVAPIGHDLKASVTDPTCTAEGFTEYFCDCGYSFISDRVKPLGHTLTTDIISSSCTKQGYTEKHCTACEYRFVSDYTAPQGHTLATSVIPPTCTEQGYTENHCTECEYSFCSSYTTPTGHNFTETTLHATSTSIGYTHYLCDCDYEYTEYVMPTDVFTGGYAESDTPLARGIDISKWNGDIDWESIKAAGFDFVIIKAGSIVGKDDRFEENYAGAKAAGLDVGAYFYTYAKNMEEIAEEAELFLSWLDGKQFEYPVYLDIEDDSMESLGRSLLTDMCVCFIETLQSEGYFCGIYTNNNWLFNILDTERIITYFDVWYARYKSENIQEWGEDWGDRLAMWQFTKEGKIDEHTCDFDFNLVYKDYPTLIKEWGYNGYNI